MARNRQTLSSTIADQLIDYINENNLQPGDRIPTENELVDIFDVGRGTIREAVKQLVALNVLTILPAKGTFLVDNTEHDNDLFGLETYQDKGKLIKEIIDIRILLDGYAVRQAATNATTEQIEYLYKLIDDMECSDYDSAGNFKADIKFHKALAEISGNHALAALSPILHSNYTHFSDVPFDRDKHNICRGHKAIVKAIEQRNPILAEAELVRHLSDFEELLRKCELN